MHDKMKIPMKELRYQRESRGWSQQRLAEQIGASSEMISKWERGVQAPSKYYQEKLCQLYSKSAEELGFMGEPDTMSPSSTCDPDQASIGALAQQNSLQNLLPFFSQAVSQGIIESVRELGSQDLNELRRKILEITLGIAVGKTSIAQLPFLETQTSLTPSIAPEEFLPQCASSLKACWHLLHNKGLISASEVLATYIPTLMTLTFHPSKYQETAASLATQAKILQAVLAMHRLDLSAREMHCLEAVRCGRLSGDRGLLAAALMYVGYTYTYCISRPEKAVIYYEEAIQALGSEISLLRSDIYIGLADVYAKMQDEQKALESITLAQNHFPQYPEQDSRFLYADCKWSELYQWEGKTYLDLAQHYPSSGYYKKAFAAFTHSAALQPVRDLSTSETMLNQAEAARGLGDLEHYENCLREGALKGLSAGSQKRYNEAYTIFQQTPKKWLKEKPMRDLASAVFHELPGRIVNS